MITFFFETCGYTNNPNFILFKWRLKRKHSPVKCFIYATEISLLDIRLQAKLFGNAEADAANEILRNLQACNFFKKETLTQVFHVKFAKFLRRPFS